jgi:hypothetical protein
MGESKGRMSAYKERLFPSLVHSRVFVFPPSEQDILYTMVDIIKKTKFK